jgi:hypothetical protein
VPRYREWHSEPAESENQGMYASLLHGSREIPGVAERVSARSGRRRPRPNADAHVPGKSDEGIVSMKRTNKGAQPGSIGQPLAEFVERRPSAKGNSGQASVNGTQRPQAALSVLDRVREAARLCV